MRNGWGLLVTAITVAGCGNGSSGGEMCLPAPDAFVASDAADGDAGPQIDERAYDEPTDFYLVGCEPGSLAGFDQTGVWHVIGEGDVGGAPWTMFHVQRIDDGACGMAGAIFGNPAKLETNDDGVFIRWSGDYGYGTLVFTFYGCRVEPDGTVWGHMAECEPFFADSFFGDPDGCIEGTGIARRVERFDATEAQGITLAGEHAGSPPWPDPNMATTTNVRVVDGIAYVTRYGDGLRIVDVSDPSDMRDLGWFEGSFNDVKIVDRADGRRFALVAGYNTARADNGVTAVDVSDPTSPVDAALVTTIGTHTLFVETIGARSRAYTTSGRQVGIFDVTDPAAPVELGRYDPAGANSPHDLYVEGDVIYLADFIDGLVILDASDPAAITEIAFGPGGGDAGHSVWVTTIAGCKYAVAGGEGLWTDANVIGVDPACPESYLQIVGTLALRDYVSVHNIMAFGDRAYIAWYHDGVRVLDLSDPTNPTLAAWFNTWDAADPFAGKSLWEGAIGIDVDLAANRLYLADVQRGLLVLDLQ